MTKDNLWIYVLKLLEKRDLYPYEVREEVKKQFGFSPGNMTAYIVLKKLRAEGFVKKTGSTNGKGPKRTYFTITAKGREELAKAIAFYKNIGRNFK